MHVRYMYTCTCACIRHQHCVNRESCYSCGVIGPLVSDEVCDSLHARIKLRYTRTDTHKCRNLSVWKQISVIACVHALCAYICLYVMCYMCNRATAYVRVHKATICMSVVFENSIKGCLPCVYTLLKNW